jgi:hypothetical protein
MEIIGAQWGFPSEQPVNGNINRPLPDEVLDISPPGFCWWRTAPSGKVNYRLRIINESGKSVYESGLLLDPVHVPSKVLPPGIYHWIVDALDTEEQVINTREVQNFTIAENALDLPWIEPRKLLSRVQLKHPRLLFTNVKLPGIRVSLNESRREAYEDLKKVAEQALDLDLMTKPDFDKYDREKEYPMRRTAYRA